MTIAPAISTAPEIWPHLTFYLEAFFALSPDRHEGGAIPFSAVDRYAARYGLDDVDEFERFRTLIRALDDAFLKTIRPAQPIGKSGKKGKTLA